MRRFSGILVWTTLLYAAGAALFFMKAAALSYKVAYPVLLLGLSMFMLRRRELLPIGIAFLLSAAGYAMGARHWFIPQMAFFALAHVAYIRWFLPRAQRRPRTGTLAVVVPLLVFLFAVIVPRAPFPAECTGTALYGAIIAGMLCSVFQYAGACAAGFRCAALLFVFSDAAIAWDRFVGPVPARTWVVMITYYLAQYLFFRCALTTAASPAEAES